MNKKALIGSFLSLFVATIIIVVLLILSLVFSSVIKGPNQNPSSQEKLKLDSYLILFNQTLEQNTKDKSNNQYLQEDYRIFEIKNNNLNLIKLLDIKKELYFIQEEKLILLNSLKLDSKSGHGTTIYNLQLEDNSIIIISNETYNLLDKLKESNYEESLNILDQNNNVYSIQINSHKEVLK